MIYTAMCWLIEVVTDGKYLVVLDIYKVRTGRDFAPMKILIHRVKKKDLLHCFFFSLGKITTCFILIIYLASYPALCWITMPCKSRTLSCQVSRLVEPPVESCCHLIGWNSTVSTLASGATIVLDVLFCCYCLIDWPVLNNHISTLMLARCHLLRIFSFFF